MGLQFGRNYKLIVSNNLTGIAIPITGLKMDFKVSRSTDSMSGKGQVSITNLNKQTREALTVINNPDGTPNLFVELLCGYGPDSELKTVLKGKAVGFHTWSPPNTISTFQVLDGVFEQTTAKFSAEYKKLDTIDKAISDLLDAVGLPTGQVDTIGERFPKKRAYNQSPKSILDQLGSDHKFRYVVQNSEQHVIRNDNTPSLTTFLLKKTTGLLGVPYQKGLHLMVNCLINPEIKVNDYVTIESDRLKGNLNGSFRVIEMTMSGGTFSSNWTMNLVLSIEDQVTQYVETYDYINQGEYSYA